MTLLEDVMTYIKDHPEEHDQASFARPDLDNECGTTCCFAGHALLLSGKYALSNGSVEAFFVDKETGCRVRDGRIPAHATRLLGITDQQSYELFYSAATLDDVELVVKAIQNNPDIEDTELRELLYNE